MKKYLLISMVIVLGGTNLVGQLNKNGTSFITNYSAEDYLGTEQNWAIIQDYAGVIYFGNNDEGIISYDGNEWCSIKNDNSSIVRSLAIDSTGRIYAGCVGDFGYLEIQENGQQQFRSLLHLVDSNYHDFSDVWKIYCTGSVVYFCTMKYIYILENDKIQSKKSPTGTFFSFYKNNELWITNYLSGLKKLKEDSIFDAVNGSFFSQKGIYTIETFKNHLLIGTGNSGLYLYDTATGEIHRDTDLKKLNQELEKNQLYTSHSNSLDDIWFGTLNNGLYYHSLKNGQSFNIGINNGLRNETVTDIKTDFNNNLWVALNNGISKIEINSSFKSHKIHEDFEESILDITTFDNKLYIATTDGVYFYDYNRNDDNLFMKISSIKTQTWAFLKVSNNELLAGTIEGLYSIGKNAICKYIDPEIRSLKNKDGTNYIQTLHADPADKSKVYVGLRNGVFSIRKVSNNWQREKVIETNKANIYRVKQYKNELWIATFYDGILKEQNRILSRYGQNQNLPSKKEIVFLELSNRLLFGTSEGIYQFDSINEQFFPFNEFSKDYHKQKIGVFRMNEDHNGNIWLSCYKGNKRWVERLLKDSIGNYRRDTIPFKRLPNEQYDAIYHDYAGVTWLGSSGGLYSFDNNFKREYHKSYNALVRKVIANQDSILFHGTNYKTLKSGKRIPSLMQPDELKPELEYNFNDLSFEFAAAFFEEEQKTEFSYYLEGDMEKWSNWNNETKAVFTNLREGQYDFKVKAKNIYGIESEIASYKFTINSPWHRTIMAYIIYAILFLITLYLFIVLYTRKLRLEKEKLEGIVKERTAEIVEQKHEIEKQAHELKESNEKLIELDGFKQSLTGMIVHDLKNPLNSIINTTENQLVSYKNRVQQSGRQMLNMVMNILDVYKYEDTHMTVDKISQNAYNIVKAATREVDFLANQKNIKITNYINTVLGIAADKDILERVFINFLSNAIKYTPNNGSIKIEADVDLENSSVLFKIVDSGVGIEKQFLPKVFELFGQVDAKKSGGVRSTGLGLTFCKMAIEAHGGQIGVDSIVGDGTTFWFTLELTESQQASIVNNEKEQLDSEAYSNEIELSEEDKKHLVTYIARLKEFMVYESTQIEQIIKEIDLPQGSGITKWVQELNNCMYSMNEEKYQELLNMVVQKVGYEA